MAILTSKGVKAPHQLRGVRKVRISRDRRGSGDTSPIENRVDTLEEDVGDLSNLKTSNKTSLVNAVNSIVPKVQGRPIVTIKTTKSTASDTSELTADDLVAAGNVSFLGSYLVTVYRNTSNTMSYFIGWVDMGVYGLSDASFTKLAGAGSTLRGVDVILEYSGGDAATDTYWIFEPIGNTQADN